MSTPRIVSEETRKKISESLRNEKHFNWSSTVTYGIAHYWMRQNFGKANKCENSACLGKSKTFDWALIHNRKHARERNNYIQLCRVCHFSYDHQSILRTKPHCVDCGILLKDWKAKRCYSHAQQYRFKGN